MKIPPYIGYPLLAIWTYAIIWFIANRQVFHPMKHPDGWWDDQHLWAVEDVTIQTADGLQLHGWWKEVASAKIVTLYLHGNAGNISHRGSHIQEISAAGSSVLVIDYRGYGKSQGRPTEKGLYKDAEAGYEFLRAKGYEPPRIIAHGESLGTSVAVDLASRRPVGAVVLEAPFTSASDVAHRVLPYLGPALVRSFNTKSKIAGVDAPLLVIHGADDQIIPFEMGRELFDAADNPKHFWKIPGATHNDIVEASGSEYRRRLTDFYAEVTGGV
jgi:fermentation-respiration switch protein FrsA (DUF1100 family)